MLLLSRKPGVKITTGHAEPAACSNNTGHVELTQGVRGWYELLLSRKPGVKCTTGQAELAAAQHVEQLQ
jgi:hypothetical protein